MTPIFLASIFLQEASKHKWARVECCQILFPFMSAVLQISMFQEQFGLDKLDKELSQYPTACGKTKKSFLSASWYLWTSRVSYPTMLWSSLCSWGCYYLRMATTTLGHKFDAKLPCGQDEQAWKRGNGVMKREVGRGDLFLNISIFRGVDFIFIFSGVEARTLRWKTDADSWSPGYFANSVSEIKV